MNPEAGYLTSFSGGVDSSFTVWRHHHKMAGRATKKLTAGLLIQGFEIPLRQKKAFQHAAHKALCQLDSLGMSLIPMVTNYRHLMKDFFDSHTPAIAACMMLLQAGFAGGVIPSTYNYAHLVLTWPSSPLTDHLLSSGTFPIHHDGAGYTRFDKIRAISAWPETRQNLRVCNQAPSRDRNCCHCEKCMSTILAFRLISKDLPPCFEEDLSTAQIATMRFPSQAELTDAQIVYQEARRLGVQAPWVQALRFTLLWNRLRLRAKEALRHRKKNLPDDRANNRYTNW